MKFINVSHDSVCSVWRTEKKDLTGPKFVSTAELRNRGIFISD